MIYLDLLLGFLRVGCFAFGGAYGAIPLIRDVVLEYGWLTDEVISNMIAVSESTPGPIMVNLATYVGYSQAGFIGALIATLGVVMPSFIVIIVLMELAKGFMKKPWVQALLRGLKPSVVGIILATGLYMMAGNVLSLSTFALDIRALIVTAALLAVLALCKFVFKKKLSSIALICVSAVLGVIVYGI